MDTKCEHCGKMTRVVVEGPSATEHSLRLDLNVTETAIPEHKVIIIEQDGTHTEVQGVVTDFEYVLEKPKECKLKILSDGTVCCDLCLKVWNVETQDTDPVHCERYS